jgi:hypothetical protein
LAYKAAAISQSALLDKEQLAKATGKHQLADEPGGSLTAVLKMQAFVDAAQFLSSDSLIIGVDIKSAFPTRDRNASVR